MRQSPLSVLVRNLFWIIPLFITISLWEFTSPIILQLVLAYIGMIILNPMVNWIESITQKEDGQCFGDGILSYILDNSISNYFSYFKQSS